ncbi:MAG TPA: DUF4180 domain-containing protein [Candidatus Acidoferrales bacterium]|nr:DUF4180 domain-containing protein [Candidatus Acidoferrales bacterium]
MPSQTYDLHGVRIFECAVEGPQLRSDRDAVDLMSEAGGPGANFIVIPAERLSDDFFRLKTRVAGEIIQRFMMYRVRVAIVGDIAQHLAESDSLRDFVREANRGNQCWFVADLDELSKRLEREKTRAGDFGGGLNNAQ